MSQLLNVCLNKYFMTATLYIIIFQQQIEIV